MALLTATDLDGKYSWTAIRHDNPKVSGEPDATLLNRNEGYEVLYFVNRMATTLGLTKKSDGLKIEKMLKTAPSELHSQEHVSDWIQKNWSAQ